MKKIVVFMLVLGLAITLQAQNYKTTVGLSIDVAGKQEISYADYNTDFDTTTGVSLFMEILNPMNQQVAFGLGVELQLLRAIEFEYDENDYEYKDKDKNANREVNTDMKYAHIPIYFTGQFNLNQNPKQTPYVLGHIGYALFTANDEYKGGDALKGGLYYAGGVGFLMQQFNMRIMYKIYNGAIDSDYYDEDFDITTSHIGLSAGIMF